jgi:hypothetical protein
MCAWRRLPLLLSGPNAAPGPRQGPPLGCALPPSRRAARNAAPQAWHARPRGSTARCAAVRQPSVRTKAPGNGLGWRCDARMYRIGLSRHDCQQGGRPGSLLIGGLTLRDEEYMLHCHERAMPLSLHLAGPRVSSYIGTLPPAHMSEAPS